MGLLRVSLTQPRTKTASFIAREGGAGLWWVNDHFSTSIYFRLGHTRVLLATLLASKCEVLILKLIQYSICICICLCSS